MKENETPKGGLFDKIKAFVANNWYWLVLVGGLAAMIVVASILAKPKTKEKTPPPPKPPTE